MRLGTRSVLFGAHCFFIHPWFVAAAWTRLYGFPTDLRLWLAFLVHDLGYMGKPNILGEEGEKHAEWGANVMHLLCDSVVIERRCLPLTSSSAENKDRLSKMEELVLSRKASVLPVSWPIWNAVPLPPSGAILPCIIPSITRRKTTDLRRASALPTNSPSVWNRGGYTSRVYGPLANCVNASPITKLRRTRKKAENSPFIRRYAAGTNDSLRPSGIGYKLIKTPVSMHGRFLRRKDADFYLLTYTNALLCVSYDMYRSYK